MGDGQLKSAVADTGPLIHLYEINSFDFIKVFERVFVPQAVLRETVSEQRVPETVVESIPTIHIHSVSGDLVDKFVNKHELYNLQSGEIESLFLCRELGVNTLLTDDLAVRTVARQFNIIPVGSLGIVVRAYHQKMISKKSATELLYRLYDDSSLFVTRAIIEIAVAELSHY